jgi:hypothetical protein
MKARFTVLCAVLLFTQSLLHAQSDTVKSFQAREGVLITSSATPHVFIFRCGDTEERIEYDPGRHLRASGVERNFDVIPGLTYLSAILTPNGLDLRPEDKKLAEEQIPKEGRDKLHIFKGADGRLFYLPHDGATPVIRVDLVLSNDRKVTLWSRKQP